MLFILNYMYVLYKTTLCFLLELWLPIYSPYVWSIPPQLKLIDTPDCVNKTILDCAIHSHLVKILWYRGDMEKAQKHARIGYQLALMIDDISALDSFWISGW